MGVIWGSMYCMYIIYTVFSVKLITDETKYKENIAKALSIFIPDTRKGNLFLIAKNLKGCYKKHCNDNQEHWSSNYQEHWAGSDSLTEFQRSGMTPNTT